MSDDLYHARLIALARAAYGQGTLAPPALSAIRDNPLCGDRAAIDVRLASGRIAALAHRVRGCLLCQASASVVGLRAPGATVADVSDAAALVRRMLKENAAPPAGPWAELEIFAPVRAHRSRHTCVFLPFEALLEALGKGRDDY